ncbi:MAG: lipid A biosynthesis acyltransferase [Pseudomonadota bacterium]
MRLLVFCVWLLHWLPLRVLGRIGEGVGSLLYRLAARRRHITLANLSVCFPQWSERQRSQVARQHFRAYMRSALERGVLWWASEQRLRKLITVQTHLPLAAIQAGPTILLCPHFVSLDVAGVAVTLNMPGCSLYARQSNPVLDDALYKGRTRFHPVALFARSRGVKPIVRAMREGLPFFMCPDMDFGLQGAEFVPFFGVPAATLTAPARLAKLTGAKVIPVVATVLPNYQGWCVSFMQPWDHYPGPDVVRATLGMNRFIEALVLQRPAEYLWSHRRFKTRPSGAVDIYTSQAHKPAVLQPN